MGSNRQYLVDPQEVLRRMSDPRINDSWWKKNCAGTALYVIGATDLDDDIAIDPKKLLLYQALTESFDPQTAPLLGFVTNLHQTIGHLMVPHPYEEGTFFHRPDVQEKAGFVRGLEFEIIKKGFISFTEIQRPPRLYPLHYYNVPNRLGSEQINLINQP